MVSKKQQCKYLFSSLLANIVFVTLVFGSGFISNAIPFTYTLDYQVVLPISPEFNEPLKMMSVLKVRDSVPVTWFDDLQKLNESGLWETVARGTLSGQSNKKGHGECPEWVKDAVELRSGFRCKPWTFHDETNNPYSISEAGTYKTIHTIKEISSGRVEYVESPSWIMGVE